jgi:hypothetical protein
MVKTREQHDEEDLMPAIAAVAEEGRMLFVQVDT